MQVLRYSVLGLISISMGLAQPDSPELEKRQSRFADALREVQAVGVLASNTYLMRNNDVEYEFRQDSDFYYLTGWESSDAALVVVPGEDTSFDAYLYVRARNPDREVWTGPQPGIEEAQAQLPHLEVRSYEQFWDELPGYIRSRDRLVLSTANDAAFETRLDLLKSSSYRFPSTIQEANDLIRPLRLIKSEYEIAQLERAIEITGESLSEAFTRIPQLKQEHELAALIEFGFTSRGVQRLGFPSIVGSGLNTTYLHYGDNNSAIPRDGLVLMDVGAEWNMYSADISRTVPADGSFSNAQRDLYDLVLKAQEAAIASVAPGVPFREPHNVAVRVVTAGLVDLGFLDGNLDSLIAQREYRQFFMHGTSHWLGLDVHDAGGYSDTDGNPHTLQAGMVLTVEPGIYISESMESVPKRYRGMGIRIEDDVLVTADGHRVLSADIPKQVNEIEALMSGAKGLFRRGL